MMKLGATQYCVSPDGADFVARAAALGLEGVEPFIGRIDDPLLDTSAAERRAWREEATRLGTLIPTTALGAFNGDSMVIDADGHDAAVAVIERALDFSRDLGAGLMLLCTYIESHPDTDEKKANLLEVVRTIEPMARERGIRIGLETPLPAPELKALTEAADSDHVGVYFDTGNAHFLGFDPVEEIRILGDLIFAIHLKDTTRDSLAGLNLGDGEVDHDAAMAAIREIGYEGWLMLETSGAEESKVRGDIEMVRGWMG